MIMLRKTPASSVVMDKPQVWLSLPEVNALCTRAARGSGLSWGIAEECGAAAVWLARHGLDWAEVVIARLDGERGADVVPSAGVWISDGPSCGLKSGITLADYATLPEGPAGQVRLGTILTPSMLLPFVARCAETNGNMIDVYLDDTHWASVSAATLRIVDSCLSGMAPAHITLKAVPDTTQDDAILPTQTSTPISKQTYAHLDALALQMTVPPSAQSHARAGAEGSDTD